MASLIDWRTEWPHLRKALDKTKQARKSAESAERESRQKLILTAYYGHLRGLNAFGILMCPTPRLLLKLEPFRSMLRENLTSSLGEYDIRLAMTQLPAVLNNFVCTLYTTLVKKMQLAPPIRDQGPISLEQAKFVFHCIVCSSETAPHLLFGLQEAARHCHDRDPRNPPINYHKAASLAVVNLIHRLYDRKRIEPSSQPTACDLDKVGDLFVCEFCPEDPGDTFDEPATVMTWRLYVRDSLLRCASVLTIQHSLITPCLLISRRAVRPGPVLRLDKIPTST